MFVMCTIVCTRSKRKLSRKGIRIAPRSFHTFSSQAMYTVEHMAYNMPNLDYGPNFKNLLCPGFGFRF